MQITETTIDKTEAATEFYVKTSENGVNGTTTDYDYAGEAGEFDATKSDQSGEQITPDGKIITQSTGKGQMPSHSQQGADQNEDENGEQGDQKGDQQMKGQNGNGDEQGKSKQQEGEQDPNEAFKQALSQMTDDQKMDFLNNLPPIFTEDQIRRIAYAVFREEYSGIAQEIEIFTSRMKTSMDKAVKNVVDEVTKSAKADARAIIDELKKINEATQLKIELKDGETKNLGVVHRETEWLIKLLQKPRHAFLTGPAGSGKTTCAEKVAEALGLSFHPMSVGPETMKSDLLGFIDANGNYHTTQVREAFEKGGLLLLDEMDAGNGASMTILNSLLSNGYCSFPDGIVQRHPNFRCVAAANTFGRGADRLCVGRNQLDAATLDRFVVRAFDYDEALERRLAGNDELVKRVQEIRAKASDLKLRVVVSPRASIIGAEMLADGFSQEDVEESCIFKYDKEFKRKING